MMCASTTDELVPDDADDADDDMFMGIYFKSAFNDAVINLCYNFELEF